MDPKQQEMALMLGYNPNAPETWPGETIDRLIGIEDSEGRRALLDELAKMLTPPRTTPDFAAGRAQALREAAEVVRGHAKDLMAYRDHQYVAKHLRSAAAAIEALAKP